MDFKNIQLPKVPKNIHDLRDYKDFFELLKFSQIINRNVNKYAEEIVYGEYLKTKSEWKEILSEKDFAKIKDFSYKEHASQQVNDNPFIFHSIGDNRFIFVKPENIAPLTGYGGDYFEFEFSITKYKIHVSYVTLWGTSRPTYNGNNKPVIEDIQIFEIDLVNKIVFYEETMEQPIEYDEYDDDTLVEVLTEMLRSYTESGDEIFIKDYSNVFNELKSRDIFIEDWMLINRNN